MSYSIEELIDVRQLKTVLKSFTELTAPVTYSLTDIHGKQLWAMNVKDDYLCRYFHKRCKESNEKCIQADAYVKEKIQDGKPFGHKCANGLWDYAAPLVFRGEHIGTLWIGQFFHKSPDMDYFRKQGEYFGYDVELYLKEISQICILSYEEYESIMTFFVLLVEMLLEQGIAKLMVEESEQKVAKEKETIKTAIDSIGDAVITTDMDGKIVMINRVAEEISIWKKAYAIGEDLQTVVKVFEGGTGKTIKELNEKALEQLDTVYFEPDTIFQGIAGENYFVEGNISPIKDRDNRIYGTVITLRDVTEKRRKEEEILYISYHDALTDLHNRRYFETHMHEIGKKSNYPISMIVGDVNGLKLTNDIYGHELGDVMLCSIAGIFRSCARKEDIVARWGGDEFAMILPKTNERESDFIYKQILEMCKDTSIDGIDTSVSLGVATSHDTEEPLSALWGEAEINMYRNKLQDRQSFHSSMIQSLEKSLFERDFETEEHAQRMKEMCDSFGKRLNLRQSEITALLLCARLHDIGKIAVADAVLLKPGKLTKQEWEDMKKHAEVGFRIASATQELSFIAKFILHHHERWDGTGYPQKLKGKEIPLISRIVSIVDAYDVMTHERPYKKAMSEKEAIEELKRCSGSQFDPELLEIFLELIM